MSKPDRVTAAGWILDKMRHNFEAILLEQRAVLLSVQTSMVKGFLFVGTDCFSVFRSAGKHQCRLGRGMVSEDREHDALIIRTKMEKAVPSQNAVKVPVQRELTHI